MKAKVQRTVVGRLKDNGVLDVPLLWVCVEFVVEESSVGEAVWSGLAVVWLLLLPIVRVLLAVVLSFAAFDTVNVIV